MTWIFFSNQSDSSEFLTDEEYDETDGESEHEYPDRQQEYRYQLFVIGCCNKSVTNQSKSILTGNKKIQVLAPSDWLLR
jgi:hypothetical protein